MHRKIRIVENFQQFKIFRKISPASATTNITGLAAGPYVFRLTVTDQLGHTGTATVQVTVNAAAPTNVPPVANAGSDQTITLPTTTGTLNGSGSSDPDGTISTYAWSILSGPGGGTISNAAIASPSISSLTSGKYVYRLIVTDNSGAKDTAQVTISVVQVSPLFPTANAGADQTIQLPTSSVTLNGSASVDPDGSISSYAWVKLTGGTATVVSASSSSTSVTGLAKGFYTFKLTVTDNGGHSATDTIGVNVIDANKPPVMDAGPDLLIELPVDTAILVGHIKNVDTTISSYTWTQVTGPAISITVINDSTIKVSGLVESQYKFSYSSMTSAGLSAMDDMLIKVVDFTQPQPTYNPDTKISGGIKKAF